MLRLINIKAHDDTLEADFVPEDTEIIGHVTYNKNTGDRSWDVVDEYYSYGSMAACGLRGIKEDMESGAVSELPATRTVMWY